jgi:hypothetical protein
MANRNVYRVSYYMAGVPKQSFICAASEVEASDFIGVRDGSAAVSTVASNVEVAGVDKAHDALAPTPVTFAPPQAEKLTQDEVEKLRQLLAKDENPVPVTVVAKNSKS